MIERILKHMNIYRKMKKCLIFLKNWYNIVQVKTNVRDIKTQAENNS